MNTPGQIRTRFERFADDECRDYSDLYFNLAHAVARDEELVGYIAQMPVTQPNLFFAAVQFLTGPDQMPSCRLELGKLIQHRGHELAALMRTRRTQTNEVGRCATILPALPDGPLALLEVGASAGLCLLPDELFYDYGTQTVGDPSSTVRLRCAVAGRFPSLGRTPEIVWRAGLDLAPVDLNAAADVRWLLSCVWADHAERRQRLEAAIELAKTRQVAVHRGDLVLDLPALMDAVPRDAQLVVFHSAVLSYLSAERRMAFANVLAEASRHRHIIWISNEAPTVIPEITALAMSVKPPQFLVGRTSFTDDRRQNELLAVAHPHGVAIEWLA